MDILLDVGVLETAIRAKKKKTAANRNGRPVQKPPSRKPQLNELASIGWPMNSPICVMTSMTLYSKPRCEGSTRAVARLRTGMANTSPKEMRMSPKMSEKGVVAKNTALQPRTSRAPLPWASHLSFVVTERRALRIRRKETAGTTTMRADKLTPARTDMRKEA